MTSETENESNAVKIKEGKAEILFSEKNEVFYNKVQELNRDLSVTAITAFHTAIHSLDPKIIKSQRI